MTIVQSNRVYLKRNKDQAPDKKIVHETNNYSIKAMVSTCLIRNRTAKSFFVNGVIVITILSIIIFGKK